MLTKKEKAAKLLELEKLDKAFRGLKLMKRTPDALFVVDSVYEGQAVKEAKTLGIPCYAICNTNGKPYDLTAAIPANTNSVKSLDFLSTLLVDAFSAKPKPKPTNKVTPKVKPAPAVKAETNAAPAKEATPVRKEEEAKTEEK